LKQWRGDYVIVFPGREVKYHRCVVCGQDLKLGSEASRRGVGAGCSRKPAVLIEQARQAALDGDRHRYRNEVLKLGIKVE
jgi:hypothetical protein